MKHASIATLQQIDELLDAVRALGLLREPRPGCFYRGSSAFLHFHENASGIFADLKLEPTGFSRLPAGTATQRAALLAAIRQALASRLPGR